MPFEVQYEVVHDILHEGSEIEPSEIFRGKQNIDVFS
jgi:hypothetical protein